MGRRRHTMAVEALVSPDAARVATHSATRSNSVHEWPKTAPRGRFHRSVYTVASPRHARTTLTLQQCTQMAKNGVERPFSPICVHCCVLTAVPNGLLARPLRYNSVHKWSETDPRGYFSQSVYTPLPPGASRPCGIRVDAHPHDRLVRPRPNRPRMGEVSLTQRTDYLCAKTHTPAQARPERHEQRGDGGNPRPQGHLKEVRQSNRRKVVR